MKKRILVSLAFSVVLFAGKTNLQAQTFNSPLEYMEYIGKEMDAITKDMWDYTSAAAHGKSARKVENRRKDLLKTVQDAKAKVIKMSPFEGDKSLRDTTVSYLKLSYNVLNYDYGKVLDMEDIAEQSYDAMEAYLLAQEKAGDKLEDASDRFNAAYKSFAEQHNIKLIEGKDKVGKKLESAATVIKYYNSIYLIFFKSAKQEAYMLDAMKRNDINAVEQNKNSLNNFSKIGLESLDTVKSYKGDATLKMTCKEVLNFYQSEVNTKMPDLIGFYLKKENFEKVQKSFNEKKPNARTQEDVDQYNKAVADYNGSIAKFNQTNEELNKKRSALIEKWNSTVSSFMDRQTPKYR